MSPTMARGRALSAGFALIALSACADKAAKQATADSSLARDLALASAQPAQPTFQDTAIAPAPRAAALTKDPPAPTRTRGAPRPETRAPRPTQQAAAQTPAPVQAPQPVGVAPAPAATPARAEIGSGAGLALTSGSKVCTSSLPGDKFVATVNSDVSGSNGAVIPAGSTVVLEVASAANGDNAQSAQLSLRVKAIVVGDKTYNVTGDVAPEATLVRTKVQNPDANADKKKVIGGAIAGAILGQMIGHNTKGTIIGAAGGAAAGAAAAKMTEKWEACLPAGAPLHLTLGSALVM